MFVWKVEKEDTFRYILYKWLGSSTAARVVHIMLNVSQYYANSLCSTNATIMLKWLLCSVIINKNNKRPQKTGFC